MSRCFLKQSAKKCPTQITTVVYDEFKVAPSFYSFWVLGLKSPGFRIAAGSHQSLFINISAGHYALRQCPFAGSINAVPFQV